MNILDFFMNLDESLRQAVNEYGYWIYLIMFFLIFAETGLIIFAILPGDSLLFTAGSLAAINIMDVTSVFTFLPLAAFAGDQANFFLGRLFGEKLFNLNIPVFFNQKGLKKAKNFYEKHGFVAIMFGRFIPLIRSFIPLVASTSGMKYKQFLKASIPGALLWSLTFIFLGFFFGKLEFVKDHLYLVIIAVVAISFSPLVISHFIRIKKGS